MTPAAATVDPQAVRAHLEELAASSGFSSSDRLSRFLRYTVEAKLRGEEDRIKEFVLGCEVFDRGADFDPRLDPIVRVEARRLRRRLEEYYAGEGQTAALRVEFPKGSYVPVITVPPGSAVAAPPGDARRRRLGAAAGLLLLLLLLLVAAAAVGWYAWRSAPEPAAAALAVVPGHWVFGENAELGRAEEELCEAVTAAIVTQGDVPVKGWPVVAARRPRGEGGAPWPRLDLRTLSRELGGVRAAMVVTLRTRSNGSWRAAGFLLQPEAGTKQWVREYDFTPGEAALRQVAAQIAADSRERLAAVR